MAGPLAVTAVRVVLGRSLSPIRTHICIFKMRPRLSFGMPAIPHDRQAVVSPLVPSALLFCIVGASIALFLDGGDRLLRASVFSAQLVALGHVCVAIGQRPWQALRASVVLLSIVPFYQVALRGISAPHWLLALPLVIAALANSLSLLRHRRALSWSISTLIGGLWLLSQFPVVVTTAPDALWWALPALVVFPITVGFLYIASSRLDALEVGDASRLVLYAQVFHYIAFLVLFLLEAAARGGFAGIQAANLYYVLGVSALALPLLSHALKRRSSLAQFGVLVLQLSLVAFSFSRGAVLILVPTFLISMLHFSRGPLAAARFFAGAAIAAVLAGGLMVFEDVSAFWAKRMNIEAGHVDYSLIFDDSGRSHVWQIALTEVSKAPLLGHGLASTADIFRSVSFGEWQFNGAHNMILTAWLERGALFGVFVVALFLVALHIGWKLIQRSGTRAWGATWVASVVASFLFAHTTGLELAVIGSQEVRVDASVMLLLVVFVGLRLRSEHGAETPRLVRPRARRLVGTTVGAADTFAK